MNAILSYYGNIMRKSRVQSSLNSISFGPFQFFAHQQPPLNLSHFKQIIFPLPEVSLFVAKMKHLSIYRQLVILIQLESVNIDL